MRRSIRAWILLLASLEAGCHRIWPFDQGASDATGSTPDLDASPTVVDRSVVELGADAGDARSTHDFPGPTDALPSQDKGPQTDLLCEPPSVKASPTCGNQCVSKPGDSDCDGMTDLRDPNTVCNELLFFDDFLSLSAQKWTASSVTASCGSVALNGTGGSASVKLASPATHVSAAKPYIVEARFVPQGPLPSSEWAVSLQTGQTVSTAYRCEVRRDAGTGVVGLHHTSSWACGSGTWAVPSVSLIPGQGYILQLFHDGTGSHCRLRQSDGSAAGSTTPDWPCPGISATPEPFTFSVEGHVVTLDWVHLFTFEPQI